MATPIVPTQRLIDWRRMLHRHAISTVNTRDVAELEAIMTFLDSIVEWRNQHPGWDGDLDDQP